MVEVTLIFCTKNLILFFNKIFEGKGRGESKTVMSADQSMKIPSSSQIPIITVVHGEGVALDGSLVSLNKTEKSCQLPGKIAQSSSIQSSSTQAGAKCEKQVEAHRCCTTNLKSEAHPPKVVEYQKCTLCGFDPVAFSKSIPNFYQELESQQFGRGEALEFWRGSLSTRGICFKCAH